MKLVEINNERFNTINTIILKGDNIENKTLYYGSSKEILNLIEFNEYGWKYIVNKYGINSTDPLKYLPDNIKNLIGNNTDDIMNFRDTFIPTGCSSSISKIDYFSSILLENQRLVLVSIPPLYKEVELFENTNKLPNFKFVFEKDEPLYSKLLWFVITSENQLKDINLSYISWLDDRNPFRNVENYLVPTYTSLNIDVCELDQGEWLDKSSNTILGNIKVENHPILDNIEKIIKNENLINKWNSEIYYAKNQVVYYENKQWISLKDDNNGEVPIYSNNWVLKDRSDIIIKTTTLDLIDSNTGISNSKLARITPTEISDISKNLYIEFYRNGYSLSKTNPNINIKPENISNLNQQIELFGGSRVKLNKIDFSKPLKLYFSKYICSILVETFISNNLVDNKNIIITYNSNSIELENNKFTMERDRVFTVSCKNNYKVKGLTLTTLDGKNTFKSNVGAIRVPISTEFKLRVDLIYNGPVVHIIKHLGFYIDKLESYESINLVPIDGNTDGIKVSINKILYTLDFTNTNKIELENLLFIKKENKIKLDCTKILNNLDVEIWK